MIHTIPATQVKNRFGEMLKRIYAHRDHIIVEKSGIAVAAIIPISVYSPIYAQRKDANPDVAKNMDVIEETFISKLNLRKISRHSHDARKEVT